MRFVGFLFRISMVTVSALFKERIMSIQLTIRMILFFFIKFIEGV